MLYPNNIEDCHKILKHVHGLLKNNLIKTKDGIITDINLRGVEMYDANSVTYYHGDGEDVKLEEILEEY